MSKRIDDLNLAARMSLPAWNAGKGPLKDFERWRYRNTITKAVKGYLKSDSYLRYKERYESGDIVNLYPWPYKAPDFANWKEKPDSTFYDLAGYRLRTAESYVAMMIYEQKRILVSLSFCPSHLFRVENFSMALRHSGFGDVLLTSFNPDQNRYVGINTLKNVKLVWSETSAPNLDGRVIVTSYVGGQHLVTDVESTSYEWFLICPKKKIITT
jgi:hypothetical protein